MKKLLLPVLMLLLFSPNLFASGILDRILPAHIVLGDSESSAKRALKSADFEIQKSSNSNDGTKVLRYEKKGFGNTVYLYIKNAVVTKVEWELSAESDYITDFSFWGILVSSGSKVMNSSKMYEALKAELEEEIELTSVYEYTIGGFWGRK